MKVVSVKFKENGRAYYFDPGDFKIKEGDFVVVTTARGTECGEVVRAAHEVPGFSREVKPVLRIADAVDVRRMQQNRADEKRAFSVCEERIAKHKLDMKLVDVEMTFDRNKLIFYFTSDGRVDFRELVKELAAVFRMRIELRQIGVRDEAKMLNGIGICGRPLCCASFLGDFQPVSIKMAKEQNLSLNPTKISGICGRLMCCLKYEEDVYEELNKKLPRVGDIISTPDGTGEILTTNVLMQQVKAAVRKAENDPPTIGFYHVDEIKLIRSKKKRKQNPEGEKHHEE